MSGTLKFEQYEVLKRDDGSPFELGRGAMGITYKAIDTDLQCPIALKVINPSLLSTDGMRERFLREARAAAQLRHPNIAAVYRLGKTADDSFFYAMEFCEGQTIQDIITKAGPMARSLALQVAFQVSKALIAVQEHHLVHRDIKPANLILTESADDGPVVKLIDFGLAKAAGGAGAWSSLGMQGFVGTAHFASPEQIEERDTDIRSDIYSLGATLWFMLTGAAPFEGSVARVMTQQLSNPPPVEKLAAFPRPVVDLVSRMLEKDPARRPQNAIELKQALQKCLDSHEPEPVRVAPVEEFRGKLSLLDLLKARGAIGLQEVLCLAKPIAGEIDKASRNPKKRPVIAKQTIQIDFGKSVARTKREIFGTAVTDWPPFQLDIERAADVPAPASRKEPEAAMAFMPTIIAGATASNLVTDLARLIYELLGGIPEERYVPLARLDEKGNSVLKRGMEAGIYTSAEELLQDLASSTSGHVEEIRLEEEPASAPIPTPLQPSPVFPKIALPVIPGLSSQNAQKAAEVLNVIVKYARQIFAAFWALPVKLRLIIGGVVALVLITMLITSGSKSKSGGGNGDGGAVSFTISHNLTQGFAQEIFEISIDGAPASTLSANQSQPVATLNTTVPKAGTHNYQIVLSSSALNGYMYRGAGQGSVQINGGETFDFLMQVPQGSSYVTVTLVPK